MASSSIPKMMSGVIIEKNGGTEVLQYRTDLPVPEPKEGQLLVKNEIIGVNYIDIYYRTGLYKPPHFPYTLGREAAGVVVAKGPGDTASISEGDRVVWGGEGAYAEYAAIPTNFVAKIPADIPSDVAAASLMQGLTALTLIREAHHVQKGDWVLVHAAAGGTGLWLCQLLKAVGAHTIGTASSEAKRELARSAGAEVVVDYTKKNYVDEIMKVTGGKGVAAVFDGVGKSTFDDSLSCVARKGTLVSFGNASGAVEPFSILRLSANNVKVVRPLLMKYITTREELDQYTSELFDFILKNKLDVRIHEVFPLKDVVRAHQHLEGRKSTGKILLKP